MIFLLILAPARAQTLLLLGDSLSTGYGLSEAPAWPELIEPQLQQRGWNLYNASISGETSAGGLSRLPGLLQQHQPQLVLIELGANDGLRGLPLTGLRKNLETMINLSQAAGAEVILAQIYLPPNYGQRYTQLFAQSYDTVTRSTQAELMPFLLDRVAGQSAFLQEDGLHPNAAAQPLIAENVWQFLQSHWQDQAVIDPDHKVQR